MAHNMTARRAHIHRRGRRSTRDRTSNTGHRRIPCPFEKVAHHELREQVQGGENSKVTAYEAKLIRKEKILSFNEPEQGNHDKTGEDKPDAPWNGGLPPEGKDHKDDASNLH